MIHGMKMPTLEQVYEVFDDSTLRRCEGCSLLKPRNRMAYRLHRFA